MSIEVSVVIPTFNSASFIEKAVTSVTKQNYKKNVEILIVDDGSTDGTLLAAQKICENVENAVLFKNKRTKGASGARNTGILNASGKYIAFLDSDDIWFDNHLSVGVQCFEKNPYLDVLFGNFDILEHKTNQHLSKAFGSKSMLTSLVKTPIDNYYKEIKDDLFHVMLIENIFHVSSVIIRSDICKTILFNENLVFSEDKDFAIRIYKEADATFAYREVSSNIYYRHASSLTHSTAIETKDSHRVNQKRLEDIICAYTTYLEKYKLSVDDLSLIRSLLATNYFSLSYVFRKQLKFELAKVALFKSIKYKYYWGQVKELVKLYLDMAFSRCRII